MTKPEADELVSAILKELWDKYRRPVLGSRLKAALEQRATQMGARFSEQELGYRGFGEYLRSHPGVSVTLRSGSDLVAVPTDESARSGGVQPLWIRPDFWRAFVTFATPDERRFYDPVADTIRRCKGDRQFPGGVEIKPVPKEAQVEWRVEFLRAVRSDEEPQMDLSSPGFFKAFSSIVRSDRDLLHKWNAVLSKYVSAYIKQWADESGLTEVRWTARREAESDDARRRIYERLDKIPVEELLELSIPLKWLLRD